MSGLRWCNYCDQWVKNCGHLKHEMTLINGNSGASPEEELARLKQLAKASLDARNAEAKAFMSWENARNNFSQDDTEARNYERKALEASRADAALREAIGG